MTSTEAAAATARTSARAVTDVTRAHLDTSARAWYGSTMIETNAPARAIDAHRAHRVALDHVTTVTTKRVDIDSPAWYDGNIEQTNTERVATMNTTTLDPRALPIARAITRAAANVADRIDRFEQACDDLANVVAAHVDWVHDMPESAHIYPNDTAESIATRWLGNHIESGWLPLPTHGHI